MRYQHRALTGQFGAPIDPQRGHRIVFDIGGGLAAIEDIVGRNVDQRQTKALRRRRHSPGPGSIDGMGKLRLAFRLVDGGIGGSGNHHICTGCAEGRGNARRFGEIKFGPTKRDHLDARRGRRTLDERGDQLAVLARNRDSHRALSDLLPGNPSLSPS